MIRLLDLTLRRGARALLEQVDLTVHAGWKVGLTGANGTGKSSLFALLRGELAPDQGEAELPAAWEIAHVAQETPHSEDSALAWALAGDRELDRVNRELAEVGHDGMRDAELHAQLEALDGYTAQARAGQLLHGLGFAPGQEHQPVNAFSGGWRMRLNLARALMCRSDLLLLDEPTNHLDLDAVLWFEGWLRRYPGTLLLISHDRDFLDNVCDQIIHLEHQRATLYSGNYTAFERIRREQLAQQQAAHARQQREIAHIRSFVDRFRAKATKARQAQSRLKSLERMELIQAAHVDSPFQFAFPPPDKCPNPLLTGRELSAGYGAQPVLQKIGFSLIPGARIGLLGHNGAGKSTFIKLLAGELAPLDGERKSGQDLRIGYFAQHQMDQLDPQAGPLHHLQRLSPDTPEQRLRDFLGGFAFSGDMATTPTEPFSGGEKARLALALLVWQKPNLLLLDEPTNHLDMQMRDALAMALQDYQGALVVVSHDRHLLRTVSDEFWLVAEGRVRAFDGDLDDYRRWLEQTASPSETPTAPAKKQQTQALRAERRQRENRLKKLDQQLAKLGEQLADYETQLADPALYADRAQAEALAKQQQATQAELAEVESEWLEISEQLEAG